MGTVVKPMEPEVEGSGMNKGPGASVRVQALLAAPGASVTIPVVGEVALMATAGKL